MRPCQALRGIRVHRTLAGACCHRGNGEHRRKLPQKTRRRRFSTWQIERSEAIRFLEPESICLQSVIQIGTKMQQRHCFLALSHCCQSKWTKNMNRGSGSMRNGKHQEADVHCPAGRLWKTPLEPLSPVLQLARFDLVPKIVIFISVQQDPTTFINGQWNLRLIFKDPTTSSTGKTSSSQQLLGFPASCSFVSERATFSRAWTHGSDPCLNCEQCESATNSPANVTRSHYWHISFIKKKWLLSTLTNLEQNSFKVKVLLLQSRNLKSKEVLLAALNRRNCEADSMLLTFPQSITNVSARLAREADPLVPFQQTRTRGSWEESSAWFGNTASTQHGLHFTSNGSQEWTLSLAWQKTLELT